MLLSAFFLHFLSCCFHRPSAVILQENQMDQLLWKDRDVSQNVKHKEYHFVSINMPHGIFSDWYILSTVFDYFQLLYKLEDYVEIERTEGGYFVSSIVLWEICLDTIPQIVNLQETAITQCNISLPHHNRQYTSMSVKYRSFNSSSTAL